MFNGSLKQHTALYRIPPLLLVCLFAICTLLVASYGLNAYLAIQQETERTHTSRTGVFYVATRLRQLSRAYEIKIPTPDTLLILEQHGEDTYQTRIFLDDHTLKEAFGPAASEDIGEATDIVKDIQGFFVREVANGLISFTLRDAQGHAFSRTVLLPPNEGGELP
jgi:hypothetical protein